MAPQTPQNEPRLKGKPLEVKHHFLKSDDFFLDDTLLTIVIKKTCCFEFQGKYINLCLPFHTYIYIYIIISIYIYLFICIYGDTYDVSCFPDTSKKVFSGARVSCLVRFLGRRLWFKNSFCKGYSSIEAEFVMMMMMMMNLLLLLLVGCGCCCCCCYRF